MVAETVHRPTPEPGRSAGPSETRTTGVENAAPPELIQRICWRGRTTPGSIAVMTTFLSTPDGAAPVVAAVAWLDVVFGCTDAVSGSPGGGRSGGALVARAQLHDRLLDSGAE